jgi:hypothetical protein
MPDRRHNEKDRLFDGLSVGAGGFACGSMPDRRRAKKNRLKKRFLYGRGGRICLWLDARPTT